MLARRLAIVAAVVAAWMACGWVFRLDANTYLLLGIPITLVFQRFVARAGIVRLWVFDAEPVRPRLRSWAWAGSILLVIPLTTFAVQVRSGAPLAEATWSLVSTAGLVIAMALVSAGRTGSRSGWQLALVATFVMVCFYLLRTTHDAVHGVLMIALETVMYFGVMFLLEEVTFRGAFDPFVSRNARGGGEQLGSAMAISLLWGLWHFPIAFATPSDGFSSQGLVIVAFQVGLGTLLSFSARRGGSLMAPAAAHAVIDAVRNALG
jgi:hypothetical protein